MKSTPDGIAARGGERTCDFETGLKRRLQSERVGKIGESYQTFQIVIAVGAAAEHAQCQIDLGGSPFDQRCAHARCYPPLPFFLPALAWEEVSSGKPFFSLASIFGSSSGSGLRSRSCAHWNLASSVRPIRQ